MTDVARTALTLVPFVAIGAFLPTWTLYVVVLLGTNRPIANGLAFVAGNATFRLALGMAALTAVPIPRFDLGGGGTAEEQALRAALLGAVFLALGLAQWRQRASTGTAARRVLELLERTPPWLSFVLGFAFCAAPGVQWLYQLGALAVIQDLDVTPAGEFAWLVAIVVVLETMLLAPVVIYAIARRRAAETLARFRRWLETNASRAAAYLLLTVGSLLMLRTAWLVLR